MFIYLLLSAGAYLYDLYAVVNHSGMLTGGKTNLGHGGIACYSIVFFLLTLSSISGHYTSYCRLPCHGATASKSDAARSSSWCSGASGGESGDESGWQWYHFDDSHVTRVKEEEVVSSKAYLLFYRRRNLSAHNRINLLTSV